MERRLWLVQPVRAGSSTGAVLGLRSQARPLHGAVLAENGTIPWSAARGPFRTGESSWLPRLGWSVPARSRASPKLPSKRAGKLELVAAREVPREWIDANTPRLDRHAHLASSPDAGPRRRRRQHPRARLVTGMSGRNPAPGCAASLSALGLRPAEDAGPPAGRAARRITSIDEDRGSTVSWAIAPR
jgi:hypothetical protein